MTTVRLQDVVQDLVELGMDASMAQAYVHLRTCGPTSAGSLAKQLDWSRQVTYSRLAAMESLGYVQQTMSAPKQYQAAEPRGVVHQLREHHERGLDRLEDLHRQVLAPLQAIQTTPEEAPKLTFEMINGRANSFAKSRELLLGATGTLDAVNLHPQVAEHGAQLAMWQMVNSGPASHLQVRAIVADTPETRQAMAGFDIRQGLEGRMLPPDNIRFQIIDGRWLLTLVDMDASDPEYDGLGDVALVSDAPALLKQHSKLFDSLWASAQPIPA